MALQVSERQAALGAGFATGLPVATQLLGLDLDEQIVSLANAVFEGDTGSASFVAGVGFYVLGIGSILAAWIGPLNGRAGIAAMGLGMGMIGLGTQSLDVARGSN